MTQNPAIESKNPVQIHPALIGVGACLATALIYPPALIGLVAGVAVWHFAERRRQHAERVARATSYANVSGPVIIASIGPNESVDSVMARAEDWREQLRLNSNPYAEIIPIIPLPYRPMVYDERQLTLGWNIYQREVAKQQYLADTEWVKGLCPDKLKPLFLSQVLGLVEEKTEQ
jgi:hypothetical protein